jgi:hypothetical protein
VVGEPSAVISELERLARDGCEIVYLHIFDIDDLDHIALLGREVVPALSEIGSMSGGF